MIRFTTKPEQDTSSYDHEPALYVQRLSAGYAGNRDAIHDVSFTIETAERVALIGPNGAGKSTLFRAIVGLIPFTSGHISIYGEDCRSSHSHVGYVPQHEAVDWSFPVSVYDVVMMGRTRHIGWFRWSRKADHERVQSLLDELKLADLANRQIGELSGGQKRRVFIARALAQDTRVLLMDEPFNGVDKVAEQDIMETLDVLTGQGITILLATHDMQKAAQYFDKVMLIKRHLLAFGRPDEVMTPDLLSEAYGGALRIVNDGNAMLMFMDENCCGD